jgi:hypothetical protein
LDAFHINTLLPIYVNDLGNSIPVKLLLLNAEPYIYFTHNHNSTFSIALFAKALLCIFVTVSGSFKDVIHLPANALLQILTTTLSYSISGTSTSVPHNSAS